MSILVFFLLGRSVARSQIQIGEPGALSRGTAPPRTTYVVKKICLKYLFFPRTTYVVQQKYALSSFLPRAQFPNEYMKAHILSIPW